MKTKEEIDNLKQSSFNLSIAQESGDVGMVLFRSEAYVTLSLAIATAERVDKYATSREAELRKEVDELRASKKLWTRINEGISEANKEMGSGDDYPVTKHAYESEIADLRQALSERDKEVERLNVLVTKAETILHDTDGYALRIDRLQSEITRLKELVGRFEKLFHRPSSSVDPQKGTFSQEIHYGELKQLLTEIDETLNPKKDE